LRLYILGWTCTYNPARPDVIVILQKVSYYFYASYSKNMSKNVKYRNGSVDS